MVERDEACPDCGGPLSLGGRFCRGCGWDADLEESEEAYLDGVDLPDQGDYAELLAREGLAEPAVGPPSWRRLAFVAAVLVTLAAFVLAYVL